MPYIEQSPKLWELDYSGDGFEKYRDTPVGWAAIQYGPQGKFLGTHTDHATGVTTYIGSAGDKESPKFETQEEARQWLEQQTAEQPGKGFAFENIVGKGSEPCNIGLVTTDGKNWAGRAFCKTQYAEKFLTAHLSVIRILDICKAEGLKVEVSDEGEYWEKRDVEALAKEVDQWDAMIRNMGGAFKGLVQATGGGASMVSAIDSMKRKGVGWVTVDKKGEKPAKQPKHGYGKKKLPIPVKGKKPYIRQQTVGRKNKPPKQAKEQSINEFRDGYAKYCGFKDFDSMLLASKTNKEAKDALKIYYMEMLKGEKK